MPSPIYQICLSVFMEGWPRGLETVTHMENLTNHIPFVN